MAMDTSPYQGVKLQILEVLGLSKDAIHIHIGMAVFVVAVVIWRKGRVEGQCLLPVIGVALLMEALDLKDDLATFGHMRWTASLHDLLNTVFWPAAVVSLAFLVQRRRTAGESSSEFSLGP